ncbi:MAG: hypothetical protein AAF518_22070, partial [Spirochaetota bacterium]
EENAYVEESEEFLKILNLLSETQLQEIFHYIQYLKKKSSLEFIPDTKNNRGEFKLSREEGELLLSRHKALKENPETGVTLEDFRKRIMDKYNV